MEGSWGGGGGARSSGSLTGGMAQCLVNGRPGSAPTFARSSCTSNLKIPTPVLFCQVSGVRGSALVLVLDQCTLTGWDSKFDLQLLSEWGSKYSGVNRSILEISWHVALTLSNNLLQQDPSSSHVFLDFVFGSMSSFELCEFSAWTDYHGISFSLYHFHCFLKKYFHSMWVSYGSM